ncbi:MAG: alpha/beta fold hydrolase [Bacteroidetes bacterium]|nr:alpha/beta fold hydrolase [Bacteroidota bacterium]
MKRIKRFLGIVLLLAIVIYVLGPKPEKPELSKDLPSISASIGNIEKYVENNDAGLRIKPDNQSRIIWANESKKERSNYSLLYLHGFSASWYEGNPAHIRFAKKFGCNLYIPRLASHGIETEDALLDMTPDRLWESAKQALMVARNIGKKVIIMSTSAGGTLALKLASDFPEYVDGLILYSPNIRINNSAAFMLSKPWGLQIGRKSNGGKYRITNEDFGSKDCQYWDCKYRMEGLVYLQQLVDETMKKETYKNVTAPVFLGYYYKDETNQDSFVKVSAMLKMYKQLGTSPDRKVKVAFPDAGGHVIASELTSGCVEDVIAESIKFGTEILQLNPVK